MSEVFKPLGDRVLIRRMPEREETDGGLLIPEFWRDKSQLFIVDAVGEGRIYHMGASRSEIVYALSSSVAIEAMGAVLDKLDECGIVFGRRVPLTVKVGDVVLMGRYSGTDVQFDGVDYTIVREEEILGVVPRRSQETEARSQNAD